MNKKQKDFCKAHNLTEGQFFGREGIDGNLYLSNLTSIPKGFNPTVEGDLYLSNLTSIPQGFNPIVGMDLYLNNLTHIHQGFNPIVGGTLDLSHLTSIPPGFNPTVGWNLHLSNLTSIPHGFNPTVGVDLFLRGLTSIPQGFNPKVGGDLYLSRLNSIPHGFNPTVGGDLYLNNSFQTSTTKPNKLLSWQDGKYISVDSIFTEVLHKKGNIYLVKQIGEQKEFYLVSDEKREFYAHGDTLKQATQDLQFKIAQDKIAKTPITMNTKISISHYRAITGACELGVKNWMKDNKITKKKILTSELLPILEKSNAYGYEKFKSLITF